MSAAGPKKESVESVAREPDLDIYDKLRRFDEKLKELEARLAPRVPSLNTGDEPVLPDGNPLPPTEQCPRCGYWTAWPHFGKCPDPTQPPTRECEGCGQRKPLEEMAVCFLPGTGESYQCEECRGGP